MPLALAALNVTEYCRANDGVPVITPVAALTVSSVGKPVAPKLVGLLLAVMR